VREDAFDVLHLVRRAAVQVRTPRQELRLILRRRAEPGALRELGQSELQVVERQVVGRLLIEVLERGLRARACRGAPRIEKRAPRRAMETSSADSICRRFVSSAPHSRARR
jgi:hypothetical protein